MESKKQKVSEGLGRLLADTYILYLKTHNFHWNITGPLFASLHLLFEKQYLELFAAVDEIAERIRALGFVAPGTNKQFAALASIKETEGVPTADQMVKILYEDHCLVDKTVHVVFKLAEEAHDQGTMDLMVKRMEIHEKTAWMLKSQLA